MLLLSKYATSKLNVSGDDVNKGMQNTQNASAMLQLYTNVILQTPDIKLPAQVDSESKSTVVEDLPKHQKLARDNATDYLSNINPLMVATLSDIIGFYNLWTSEYARLVQLANAIDDGDNAKTFSDGIQNLIRLTKKKSDKTQPVISALKGFLPKVQTDASHFKGDLDNVNIALGGEKGELAQLGAQLDSINSAMKKDIEMIGGGAVGEVVGVLMITVGALAEFETAGASTALIVGGLAVVGGSSAVIGIAGKDLAAKQAQYKSVAAQLAQDKQVFTLTNQSSTYIATLLDAVNNGIAAVETLQKGWDSLSADFAQVVEALGSADPDLGSWLVNTLASADKDWKDTYQLALHLQQTGVLPVKQGTASFEVSAWAA